MMATHTARRVFNYAGAIFIVLLLGGLLIASYMLLDVAKASLLPHSVRTPLTASSLPQNNSTFCSSRFMASHAVFRSYLCSGVMELLPRELPPIVPPLATTNCEGKTNFDQIICNGQLLKTVVIIASVSAGIVVLITCVLVAWTVIRWIITVRPSYLKRKTAQFARAMEKSRRSRGIIGTEESLEEGTMKYPLPKPRAPRRAEKYVTFRGVRALLPWGKGSEWSQAEVEVVRRGIMPGFMVGMTPPQIDMNIIEPGELERGDIFARYSGASGSEDAGSNHTTRVVSTGHEIKGLSHTEFRRRSGVADGFPEL